MAGITEREILALADDIGDHPNIRALGLALGFKNIKIDQYLATNRVDGCVGSKGTLNMLFDWKQKTRRIEQRPKFIQALAEAGFSEIGQDVFGEQDKPAEEEASLSSVRQTSPSQPSVNQPTQSAEQAGSSSIGMNRAKDFDDVLKQVAEDVTNDGDIEELGRALGFSMGKISNYLKTNMRFGSVDNRGTLKMLRDWNQGVRKADEVGLLRKALESAKLHRVADEHLPQGVHIKSATASNPPRSQPRRDTPGHVTEKQLLFLATNLLGDFYAPLATELGFGYAEYENIRKKHQLDQKDSTLEILHMWKNKTGGSHSELDRALENAECLGLMHKYKNE